MMRMINSQLLLKRQTLKKGASLILYPFYMLRCVFYFVECKKRRMALQSVQSSIIMSCVI